MFVNNSLESLTIMSLSILLSRLVLVTEAIIIFDEINQIPYPGETLAVIETIGISSLKIERFSWETGISYAIIGEK